MKKYRRKYKDLTDKEKLNWLWSAFSTILLIVNIIMAVKLWS